MMQSARDRYLERLDSADIPASQKKMLVRLAGISSTSAGHRNEVEVTDEDGQLSLPYVKRMLTWLAEGVGRGLELAGTHEAAKEMKELLGLLISTMGEIYLETALDAQIEAATLQENTKTEPDFTYLSELQASVSILHLLVVTIQTLLMPLASSNLTLRRELDKTTNTFVERMEMKIDNILQKALDSAMSWTAKLFAQQKKTDFRPKDEAALDLAQLQTPTCTAICAFLGKLYKTASLALSGQNLHGFGLELGLGLRSLLLAHFKSFQVNQAGGVLVIQDMTRYIQLLKSFELPDSFDLSLELLTEIPNLFTLRGEALKDHLRGVGSQTLAGIERGDLRPYILRRDDAYTVAVQSALGSL